MESNIKALLLSRTEVTRTEFAARMGHGPSWASDFLNGRRHIKLDNADAAAAFFGIDVMELFGNRDETSRETIRTVENPSDSLDSKQNDDDGGKTPGESREEVQQDVGQSPADRDLPRPLEEHTEALRYVGTKVGHELADALGALGVLSGLFGVSEDGLKLIDLTTQPPPRDGSRGGHDPAAPRNQRRKDRRIG